MPVAGGGFEQAYNAQALVAADSLLVVTNDVVQAPTTSDKSSRRWKRSPAFPEALGAPETLLADSGYFSEANVNACAEAETAPLITPAGNAIISPGRTASPARRRPRRTRRRWKR